MSMARKLKRQVKVPFSQSEYQFVYNKVKAELRDDLERRIKERINTETVPLLRQEVRKEVAAEVTNEAYAHFLAVACNILMNDYGKLKNKKTRLKVFYEKLNEYSEEIDKPSEKQLAAEAELEKQVDGIIIQR